MVRVLQVLNRGGARSAVRYIRYTVSSMYRQCRGVCKNSADHITQLIFLHFTLAI